MPSSYYAEVDPNESGISIDLDETILEEDDTNDSVNSGNDFNRGRNCTEGGTNAGNHEIQGDRNAGGKTDKGIKNPYKTSTTNNTVATTVARKPAIAAADVDAESEKDIDEQILPPDAEILDMEQSKTVSLMVHRKDRDQGKFDGSSNPNKNICEMEVDEIENAFHPKNHGAADFTPMDRMTCGSTQPMVLRGGGPSSTSSSSDIYQQNPESFKNRLLSQSIQNAMNEDDDSDDDVDNLTESQLLKLLAKRQKERQRALAESLYKDSDSEKGNDSDCDGDDGDRFNFSCVVGSTESSFDLRTQSFQQCKGQQQQCFQQPHRYQTTQQSQQNAFMTQETFMVNNRTVNDNVSFDLPKSETSGNRVGGDDSGLQQSKNGGTNQTKNQQHNNHSSKNLNCQNKSKVQMQPKNNSIGKNEGLGNSGMINPYQKHIQKSSQSSSSSYTSTVTDTQNVEIERHNPNLAWFEDKNRNRKDGFDTSNSKNNGNDTRQHAVSKSASGGHRNATPVHESDSDPLIHDKSSKSTDIGNDPDSACYHDPAKTIQRRRKSFFDNDQQLIARSRGGWEEDAFRSSLVDLLTVFPASLVNGDAIIEDVTMSETGEKSDRFHSPACEEECETPCSTTSSQAFESTQLQQKRSFDAASRALVRLAIASRGTATGDIDADGHGGGNTSVRNHDDRATNNECDPPSPRSLPCFISVLNVPGSNSIVANNDQWTSNHRHNSFSSSLISASQEVFVGQSVHGRNARTVCLWSGIPTPKKKGNCFDERKDNSDTFKSWSTDKLAFVAMKVAARVCHQSCVHWHQQHASGSMEGLSISIAGEKVNTGLAAGFVEDNQSRNGNSKKTKTLSSSVVESSLEFLATSFACLEADLVYSVLGTRLSTSSVIQSKNSCLDTSPKVFTVLDVLLCFSVDIKATVISPMTSTLAFLTLSRGLSAAQYVARYATSLNPSSCCSAYCSTNFGISKGTDKENGRIDDGGIGWLSALGKDLGLSLESEWEFNPNPRKGFSGSRYSQLCLIASTIYDCIMEYDPAIANGMEEFASSCEEKQNAGRKVRPHSNLFIETGGFDHGKFRQSSIIKDRVFAGKVEYLSSLIQIGVVVGWLSGEQTSTNNYYDGQRKRTVNNLCQKLFLIVETRSRLRHSTNQNISKSDPGDSEAVCAACLSLLVLSLERHRDSKKASSLSSSFRHMGGSSGKIEDLFESPMLQKITDRALSWSDSNAGDKITRSHGKDFEGQKNKHAMSYSIHILCDIVKAGAGPLLRSKFPNSMDKFLTNFMESICKRGRSQSTDMSSDADIESILLLILHLHECCSAVMREYLRSFLEQSSVEQGVGNNVLFTSGILFLCADKSFAVSSCASSLLRVLLDGTPTDRTQDLLSELLQQSLNNDPYVGLALEHAFFSLFGVFHANENDFGVHVLPQQRQEQDCDMAKSEFPSAKSSRWDTRTCCLCDLLGVCSQSATTIRVLSMALSSQLFNESIMDIFLRASIFGSHQYVFDINTLNGSAHLALLFLLTTFSTSTSVLEISEQEEDSFRRQQSIINQHTTIVIGRQSGDFDGFFSFSTLQVAMIQGSSVDLTHRAMILQPIIDSLLCDTRSLALNLTLVNGSLSNYTKFLLDKVERKRYEFGRLLSKYERVEIERDNLMKALNDQRLGYHRQLEWMKTEALVTSRNSAQIHVSERKRAEDKAKQSELERQAEMEARISAENVNQQLTEEAERLRRELSSQKSRIQDLEKILEEERRSRQQAIISLDHCKMNLANTSEELEKTTFLSRELQSKLNFSEEREKELNASNHVLEASLEDICSKLIKLSCIYQSKEESTIKVKNELRSALIAANKHADTAISKYETTKQENKELRKKLDQTSRELQQIKAHRADLQRQRKHAPISYINQLHKESSLKDKRQQKRLEGADRARRSGKENVCLDG